MAFTKVGDLESRAVKLFTINTSNLGDWDPELRRTMFSSIELVDKG